MNESTLFSDPDNPDHGVGEYCHQLAHQLFPICRSLTGPGTRETITVLEGILPELKTHSVASGSTAFDWAVPDEWTIIAAYLEDEAGNRIVDFANNNLHVMGYSEPIDTWLELDALQKHLHSLPDQPDAIPYITSYYSRNWGFCITDDQRKTLNAGKYHAVIKSELKPGVLNYAELILPGETNREVFLSTYICHPSMANNELSGPVVATALALWLMTLGNRKFTYRIIFIPETIGSIVYLSKNLDHMKKHTHAGFNLTCIGDDRAYSYLPSRDGNTLSDRVAKHVLHHIDPEFARYNWLDRGSDERQYCSPGVDLPIATIMRSKYGIYPEYHTSKDDLTFVTPSGLQGGFSALRQAIEILENDFIPKITVLCEPQLGKRGLYPSISTKGSNNRVRTMMSLISYCDGENSLFDISELVGEPFHLLQEILGPLIAEGLIEISDSLN